MDAPTTLEEPNQTEQWLRATYGPDAVFSRSGNITLVHLDSPGPATVRRRTREFDPRAWFVDDCPLCRSQQERGGYLVFGAPKRGAPGRESAMIGPPPSGPDPSVLQFASAIDRIATASDALIASLGPTVPPALQARAALDIATVSNRILDAAWSDSAAQRRAGPARAISAAIGTLQDVRIGHPEIAGTADELEAALGEITRLLDRAH